MMTLPVGIVFLGLCVLGVAVAVAILDTWWLQRKAAVVTGQASAEMTDHHDDPFLKVA